MALGLYFSRKIMDPIILIVSRHLTKNTLLESTLDLHRFYQSENTDARGLQIHHNIFAFSLQRSELQTSLERDGNYYLGDLINKFIPGTFFPAIITNAEYNLCRFNHLGGDVRRCQNGTKTNILHILGPYWCDTELRQRYVFAFR